MPWSMPPRVLQVVAGLLGLVAISAFTLGVVSAPQRGRLPGERADSSASTVPLEATDATPLSQERIEGPPAPAPLTPEEKAQQDADKAAKAAAKLAAAGAAPAVPPTQAAPAAPEKAAEAPPPAAPPQEEAPH